MARKVRTEFEFGPEEPTTLTRILLASDEFESRVAKKQVRVAEKKSEPKTIANGTWERAVRAASEMLVSGDAAKATPIHFVALFTILFERVYGFEPMDLTPQTRMAACGMASSLARAVFGFPEGGGEKTMAYVAWVWEREREREEWRKKNGKGGQTLGWRLVFGRALLNDYANDLRRAKK